jgi:hypothetical protein
VSGAIPVQPRELLFEDFVAAWLSALGYFVETRVRQHNVLELDVVTSDMADPPTKALFEAKSGRGGFADLFKVFGWRTYLGIPKGYVARSKQADGAKATLLGEVSERTAVNIITVDPASSAPWDGPIEPVTAVDPETRQKFLEAARHQRTAVRRAHGAFERVCKSASEDDLFQRARRYDYAVEASFFARTPRGRIEKLYAAFRESPKLTGEFVERLARRAGVVSLDMYRRLENDPEALHVQYIMLLEHRARILIIRHALDLDVPTRPPSPSRGPATSDAHHYYALPQTFRDGHERLRSLTFRSRVPYVLQVFLEYFGGMYASEGDLDLLSRLTGLTGPEVEQTIALLDVFFPKADDDAWRWCSTSHGGRLTRLKFCPAIARGAGALLHRVAHGHDSFTHLGPRDALYSQWSEVLIKVVQEQVAQES